MELCYRCHTTHTTPRPGVIVSSVDSGRDGSEDPRLRFGKRLAMLRRARGWTQQDLADRSGINRTYISALEHGERNIGLLNLARLAEALEVPAVELLRWERDVPGPGTTQ